MILNKGWLALPRCGSPGFFAASRQSRGLLRPPRSSAVRDRASNSLALWNTCIPKAEGTALTTSAIYIYIYITHVRRVQPGERSDVIMGVYHLCLKNCQQRHAEITLEHANHTLVIQWICYGVKQHWLKIVARGQVVGGEPQSGYRISLFLFLCAPTVWGPNP